MTILVRNEDLNEFRQLFNQSIASGKPGILFLNNANIIKSAPSKRKKQMFTDEEDNKLIMAVKQFGDKNWSIIASVVGTRTKRQCYERWHKFLCPTINVSSWTDEEDRLILEKYKEYGPKWSFIRKFFNNRTDISIKTRCAILQRRIKKKQDFLDKINLPQGSTKSKENQNIQDDTLNIDLFDPSNATSHEILNENYLEGISKAFEKDIWRNFKQGTSF